MNATANDNGNAGFDARTGAGPAEVPLEDGLRELLARVKERLEPADAWMRRTAAEQPLLTIAVALGAGYCLGRLIRKL